MLTSFQKTENKNQSKTWLKVGFSSAGFNIVGIY